MLSRSLHLVLAGAVILVSCSAHVPVRNGFREGDRRPVVAQQPGTPLPQPYVLLVTGPKTCSPPEVDIRDIVKADAQHASTRLGIRLNESSSTALQPIDANGTHMPNPTADQLETAIDVLATSGYLKSGLVLLYTGHGAKLKTAAGDRSHLCLEGGKHDVADVVKRVGAQAPNNVPWLAMVLNSCQSAFVDISSASFPVGLIAASPNLISVHAFPRRDSDAGSCAMRLPDGVLQAQPTPFVRAAVGALASPYDRNHDRNEDGIVTLHELFHVLSDATMESWRDCDIGRPEPKLQLQARSEIPIRFHERATGTRAQIESIMLRLEEGPGSPIRDDLLKALRGQLELSTRRHLPETQWDFVISNSLDVGMRIPSFEQQHPSLPTDCWGHLVHLSAAPPLEYGEQLALARFSIFSTFYELRRQGASVDLLLPYEIKLSRINTTLQTIAYSQAIAAIQPRIHNLSEHWFRSTTEVPKAEKCRGTRLMKILNEKQFGVCAEDEGQCFTDVATP